MDYAVFARKALDDEILSRAECHEVLKAPDEDLLALLHAAFTVRARYFGKTVRLQMLQNAKSGACQEDCHYCSQSAVSTAAIDRYNLLPQSQMIEGARRAAASKAQRYCIVISGRSPLDREIEEIAGAVRAIKGELPIQICCSLGLMNEAQAMRLKAAGVDRVNHNLNTSEAFHGSICTTHTFDDRLATIRNARAAGLEICSGGIVGMGEADDDLIDLAMALREVKPDSIPVNKATTTLRLSAVSRCCASFGSFIPARKSALPGAANTTFAACSRWRSIRRTQCSSMATSRHQGRPPRKCGE